MNKEHDLLYIEVLIKPSVPKLTEGESFTFLTEWEAGEFISKMIKIGIDNHRMQTCRFYKNKGVEL